MSDELIARAKTFFDKQRGLQGEGDDPELKRMLRHLSRNVEGARADKGLQISLLRTLQLLERDIKIRRASVESRTLDEAKRYGKNLSSEELAAAVTRGIPRELRYIQSAGLSLVQSLNSNSKMTEKELHKFNERLERFSTTVDALKSDSGKNSRTYAQEKMGGLSLTERLRQYEEGKLLDGTRHKELLDTLKDSDKKADKRESKDTDTKKLGLTALFGPAAPLFQLWYEAKEDLKKIREDTKETWEATKEKFKWERDNDKDDDKVERKHTSLLERILKALKRDQSSGKSGKSGLLGSLFGDADVPTGGGGRGGKGRGRGRGGRVPGRTAGRGILGRIGGAAATAARTGWSMLAGAATVAGGALGVAGAGLAGYQLGTYINDNLLTDEQKEAIGNAIGRTVDFITGSGQAIGTALASASVNLTGFFSNAGKTLVDSYTKARDYLADKSKSASEFMTQKLMDTTLVITDWSKKAEDKLDDFWKSMKTGVTTVATVVAPVVQAVRQNAADFVSPQSGGIKLPDEQKTVGERARERVDQVVSRAQRMVGTGGAEQEAMLQQQLTAAGITDPNERAMFMAQMSHESMGFKRREESFNYRSADRIAAVSSHARRQGPEAIAAAMARGPEAIAELMYGGRRDLGNTEAGDGHKYRGRGFNQLTGRANYRRLGQQLGIDLEGNPDLLLDPEVASRVAIQDWKNRGVGAAARRGDVAAVTQRINGGQNGAADRERLFRQYQAQGPKSDVIADGVSVAGPGRGTAVDPRRLDIPQGFALNTSGAQIASARPLGSTGYTRVTLPPATPQVIQQQAPAATPGATSTSGISKISMEFSDFYVDDLGLIISNRGLTG